MIQKNANIIFKRIITFLCFIMLASCSKDVRATYVKVGEEKNKLYFQVLLTNKRKADTVHYNLDKLNLSCAEPEKTKNKIYRKRDFKKYNNVFILENENKEFRIFDDFKSITSSQQDNIIKDRFILHCSSTQMYKLNSKETIYTNTIGIDRRLLKVKLNDKKVRLWYVYDENNVIVSNWIDLNQIN